MNAYFLHSSEQSDRNTGARIVILTESDHRHQLECLSSIRMTEDKQIEKLVQSAPLGPRWSSAQ